MHDTQLFALKLFVNSKRQSETVIPMAGPEDKRKSDAASPRVEDKLKTSAAAPRTVGPKSSADATKLAVAKETSEASSHTGPPNSTNTSPQAASKLDTPLLHLNIRTGGLSKWDVSVALAHKEDYEYTWDGKPRKGQVFRCFLTSVLDHTKYCLGEVRKEKGDQPNALDNAMGTFKDGLLFRLSQVQLSSKTKTEYNSCTHKVCVTLNKTTTCALMQPSQRVLPLPTVTCADCVGFKSFQSFDITSLVHTVSEARTVGGGRFVRDVYLVDGSKTSDVEPLASQASADTSVAQLVRPKVAVYYARTGLDDPAWMQSLIAAAKQSQPFHFFGLQAQTASQGQYKIETARWWYTIMPATGPKATRLIEMFPSINENVSITAPMTLETTYQPRDESDDILASTAGTETFCSHLGQMSQVTGLDGIDGQVTVWQCNWAFASVVGKDEDLLKNDGSKLWMWVLAEDVSGSVTFRMGEKVALQLSGLANKETFLRAVKDGDPVFPTLLSFKASRKVKLLEPGDASSLTVNMQIVDARPQDVGLTRTQSVMDLVPIMKSFKSLTSAIMPATMAMLTSSTIYPLCVRYPGMDAQPCNKAWVLLKTTTKSVWLEEPPYTVTTDGVQDALGTDAPEESGTFTLVSLATKSNQSSLRLSPAYGKPAHALAVISSLEGKTLYAETVEVIQVADVQPLQTAMRQEMAVAAELARSANNKPASWSEDSSPLVAKRCREIGRSPTGPAIDPLPGPDAKISRTM